MNLETDFDDADPGERESYSIDFSGHVIGASVILSAVWEIAVVSVETGYTLDASPTSRLYGPAVTAVETPLITSQFLDGLMAGNRYRVRAIAQTDKGEIKSNYSHVRCRPLA